MDCQILFGVARPTAAAAQHLLVVHLDGVVVCWRGVSVWIWSLEFRFDLVGKSACFLLPLFCHRAVFSFSAFLPSALPGAYLSSGVLFCRRFSSVASNRRPSVAWCLFRVPFLETANRTVNHDVFNCIFWGGVGRYWPSVDGVKFYFQ